MPFGKHQSTPMQFVPMKYLLWLRRQSWMIEQRPDVLEYIDARLGTKRSAPTPAKSAPPAPPNPLRLRRQIRSAKSAPPTPAKSAAQLLDDLRAAAK
jgi:hypothetical protein